MTNFIEPYDIFDLIQVGCFSPVYKGSDRAGNDRPVRILNFEATEVANQWEHASRPLLLSNRQLASTYPPFNKRYWIVTEWFDHHLGDYWKSRKLNSDQAATLLRQTLEALDEYHSNGIVHGAICPATFLIGDNRYAKLDYSPGLMLNGEVTQRIAHHEFTPPETINPGLGPIGPQADFYSLGMSVAALLHGPTFVDQFPFIGLDGDDGKTAWQSWHSRPKETLESIGLLETLPPDLSEVIAKLTAKRVSDRPDAVADIYKMLKKRNSVPIELSENPVVQKVDPPSLVKQEIDNSIVKDESNTAQPQSRNGEGSKIDWKKLALPGAIIAVLLLVIGIVGFAALNKETTDKPKDNRKADVTPKVGASEETTILKEVYLSLGKDFCCQILVSQNGVTVPKNKNGSWQVDPSKDVLVTGQGFLDKTIAANSKLPDDRTIRARLIPQLPKGYLAVDSSGFDPFTHLPNEIYFNESAIEIDCPLHLMLVSGRNNSDLQYSFGAKDRVYPAELSHEIRFLDKPFYISKNEVTKYQEVFMKHKESGGELSAPEVKDFTMSPSRNILFEVAARNCRKLFLGRLPREHEWELAARGPQNEGFPYPWGDSPNKNAILSISDTNNDLSQAKELRIDTPTDDISPYGIRHMMGNASEWCTSDAGNPVVRGGSFRSLKSGQSLASQPELRVTWRKEKSDGESEDYIGYRVVVDVDISFTK